MKVKLLFSFLFLVPLVYAVSFPANPVVYDFTIKSACSLNGLKLIAKLGSEVRGSSVISCTGTTCYSEIWVTLYNNESNVNLQFFIVKDGVEVSIYTDKASPGVVKSVDVTVTSDQCNILFGTQPTQPSEEEVTGGAGASSGVISGGITPTENITETIIKKLEQEGIKEIIQKIIPVQNITEVKIVQNITLEIKPKVEEVVTKPEIKKVIEKIKEELAKLLKKEVKVEIKPVETKVIIQLIKIKTKNGEEKHFTKVEKIVKAGKVIEVIPKDFAETADKVIWIKGKVLKIIEEDPVFEVQPENNTIAYLAEGNKTEEAKETITVTYTYETIEKPIQNITNTTQPFKPQNITNLSKPTKPQINQNVTQQNVTVQKGESQINVIPLAVILLLTIIVIGYYLVKTGRIRL